jgi:hypothetical protein
MAWCSWLLKNGGAHEAYPRAATAPGFEARDERLPITCRPCGSRLPHGHQWGGPHDIRVHDFGTGEEAGSWRRKRWLAFDIVPDLSFADGVGVVRLLLPAATDRFSSDSRRELLNAEQHGSHLVGRILAVMAMRRFVPQIEPGCDVLLIKFVIDLGGRQLIIH